MEKQNLAPALLPLMAALALMYKVNFPQKNIFPKNVFTKSIEDNNDKNQGEFTNIEFYNMMLNHESQINEMLKSSNAYIAREGNNSYSFELDEYKSWNEENLTIILELAKKYLDAMKDNRLDDAQNYAEDLIKMIENSILELAFIAEDNQYDSLTRLLNEPVKSNVTEAENKIIFSMPDENGIEKKYVFAAVGDKNYAFNALSALDISAYNQGRVIRIDKTPIELVDNFFKATTQPVYCDTLQKRDALNVAWNDKQELIYTEWFYDTHELEKLYKRGLNKAKKDLGYNPDDYKIIVDNNTNSFIIVSNDGSETYTFNDSDENEYAVCTALCDLQGLTLADSDTNQGTYNTAVDYSDAFITVDQFVNEDAFQFTKRKNGSLSNSIGEQ